VSDRPDFRLSPDKLWGRYHEAREGRRRASREGREVAAAFYKGQMFAFAAAIGHPRVEVEEDLKDTVTSTSTQA